MRKFIPILLIILTIFGLFIFFQNRRGNSDLKEIKVGNASVFVTIADSENERVKGLSGTTGLADNQGMLFVYDRPGIYSFWMFEMLYPLDFIWINNDRVVEVSENIPNPTQNNPDPVTLVPSTPVDKILEVPAGFVAKNNIKVGDVVK
ncbi:DUF192 domain-containing protein [Candidatus Gottesmanbacteria bacterium]|nr:DUF192 domain-containing protein [Candidatus Gottesmanbacteria bacterium]